MEAEAEAEAAAEEEAAALFLVGFLGAVA